MTITATDNITWMTIKSAAKRFGYTDASIRQFIKKGNIPTTTLDDGRGQELIHVSKEGLQAYFKRRESGEGSIQATVVVQQRAEPQADDAPAPAVAAPTRENALAWLAEQLQAERTKSKALEDTNKAQAKEIEDLKDEVNVWEAEVDDLKARLAEAQAAPKGTPLTTDDLAVLTPLGFPVSA